MFFIVSKLYQMVLSPVPLLLLLTLTGAILTASRAAWLGRRLAIGASLALVAIAMTPIPDMLIAPLEDRFPPPPADAPAPYGIIVLGGAIKSIESRARGLAVSDEGDRVVQAALLARRYPDARIVFSGGNGSLTLTDNSESDEARKLLVALGVDPARITLESQSRNTDENARFTAATVHPQPGQRWLLVTSAFHMPRSMGLFDKAGFDVVAWPVAYRTLGPGRSPLWARFDAPLNLQTFATAAKEWMGLATYWATGRIDRLFPGPRDGAPVSSGA